jgi:hypothetical protein
MLGDRFRVYRRRVFAALMEAVSALRTANDIGHDLAPKRSNG